MNPWLLAAAVVGVLLTLACGLVCYCCLVVGALADEQRCAALRARKEEHPHG